MVSSRSFSSRKSYVRSKLKSGKPVGEEELALLPAEEVASIRDGTYKPRVAFPHYGHDERQRSAVALILKDLEPILRFYERAIAEDPDLSNRNTMAAAHLVMIRNATTTNQVERSLDRLSRLFHNVYQLESKPADPRTVEQRLADLVNMVKGALPEGGTDEMLPSMSEGNEQGSVGTNRNGTG